MPAATAHGSASGGWLFLWEEGKPQSKKELSISLDGEPSALAAGAFAAAIVFQDVYQRRVPTHRRLTPTARHPINANLLLSSAEQKTGGRQRG